MNIFFLLLVRGTFLNALVVQSELIGIKRNVWLISLFNDVKTSTMEPNPGSRTWGTLRLSWMYLAQ